ncbi:hypothetical protein [Clostridium sp. FP1]|uniref:hypothetical protein n=1 Tax=Clostridium sp. FP1 TaxID=2724076 RepID=UPI0013E90F8D|nr:hypothetical protein [Clostridium sp. FP1]MBZ9633390.1 hypothetical protein [Clostridium sp. FP1]
MMKNESNKDEEIKKVYSLSELVEEIYLVNKETSKNYDACYKELQRIDKVLRGNSDYSMSKGILEDHKEKYVSSIKKIVNDSELKKIIAKIGSNKKLTDEEYKKYTEFMLKNINDENIKEKVNDMESIKQKIEKIDSKVKYIINLIPNYFDVESTDLMEIVLDEYEKEIDKLHKKIQERCEELDEIDDMRYKEKLIKTLTGYGSNNIRNMKSKDKKS